MPHNLFDAFNTWNHSGFAYWRSEMVKIYNVILRNKSLFNRKVYHRKAAVHLDNTPCDWRCIKTAYQTIWPQWNWVVSPAWSWQPVVNESAIRSNVGKVSHNWYFPIVFHLSFSVFCQLIVLLAIYIVTIHYIDLYSQVCIFKSESILNV